MRRHCSLIGPLMLLLHATLPAAARDAAEQSSLLERQTGNAQPEHLIIGGMVRRVLGSGVFIMEDRQAADRELLVLAPEVEATPVVGTTVIAAGMFRQFDEPQLEKIRGWHELDEHTRTTFAGRPILVATSVSTAGGRELTSRRTPVRTLKPFVRRIPADGARDPLPIRLHPGGLAELIDQVGGRRVALSAARVLVVLNPRAFLVESVSPLTPLPGNLDRLLVLVDAGALRVDAASLVGSNVRVVGTARTLLGMQVTGEVPVPRELTPEIVKRFEIRAAMLATSVQTTDGVELTEPR